jgi:hypothetical protein
MLKNERYDYINSNIKTDEQVFTLDTYQNFITSTKLKGTMGSYRFEELLDMFNAKEYVKHMMSKIGANKKYFSKNINSTFKNSSSLTMKSEEIYWNYPDISITVLTDAEEFYNKIKEKACQKEGYTTEVYNIANPSKYIEFSYDNFNFILNEPLGILINNTNFENSTIFIYSPDETRDISYKEFHLEKLIEPKIMKLKDFKFSTKEVLDFICSMNFNILRDMKIWEETISHDDKDSIGFYLKEFIKNNEILTEFQTNFKILTDDDYFINLFDRESEVTIGKSYCILRRRFLKYSNGEPNNTEWYLYLIKIV